MCSTISLMLVLMHERCAAILPSVVDCSPLTSAQRPASSMPNSAVRRCRLPPPKGLRLSDGVSSARSPAKLSRAARARARPVRPTRPRRGCAAVRSLPRSRRRTSAVPAQIVRPLPARVNSTLRLRRRRRRCARPDRRAASRQQRHRCRADRSRTIDRRCGCREREPRPRGAPGKAQIVQPREVVAVETCRQDLRLPRRGGRLEPLQLRNHRGQCVRPLAPLVGMTCCQRQQEAHEVPARYRLDLLPQPLHRVAVNAREQRPVAPFRPVVAPGVKRSLHHDAFHHQLRERGLDVGHREPHRLRDAC